jgi:hypothetical protein
LTGRFQGALKSTQRPIAGYQEQTRRLAPSNTDAPGASGAVEANSAGEIRRLSFPDLLLSTECGPESIPFTEEHLSLSSFLLSSQLGQIHRFDVRPNSSLAPGQK